MNEPLELEIMTAQASVLRAYINDLFIPAFFGEAGILSHHLPYISILKTGEVSYLDTDGNRHYMFLENGVLEVRDNRIVIMADAIENGAEMDGGVLQREMAETEARIKSSFFGQISPEELVVELDRQRKLQLKLGIWKKSRHK